MKAASTARRLARACADRRISIPVASIRPLPSSTRTPHPSAYPPTRHLSSTPLRLSSSSSSSSTTEPSTSSQTTATPLKTYYTLFPQTLSKGPPPAGPFTIPLRALRTEFLALQQRTHPDLFPPSRRRAAEAASAQLNTAYTTLCDPLLRAGYLLTLHGHADPSHDETARLDDPSLMMEVLEAQEALESAESEEDVAVVKRDAEGRTAACVDRLEELFAKNAVDEAKEEVMRLRYWRGVVDAAHRWEKGGHVVLHH
ncbi:hypothetical protein TWF696_001998 [Orbilia brochopaga]|uniref:Co-chaperone HscB C-terminal oligomerisation domain-containing protein n=1 Tax=Orbilia brochopaga TaxID=3140254 RepID=A0AAV9UAT1_9PEZI